MFCSVHGEKITELKVRNQANNLVSFSVPSIFIRAEIYYGKLVSKKAQEELV